MCNHEIQLVYLSPHLDDAVLSCGGLIYHQARDGNRPLVITCFAGIPDYRMLSSFAMELHQDWGQATDPVERRRCEDATALRYLGADYQHWDYLDCIYRRAPGDGEFLYVQLPALFGPVRSEEQGLPDELALRLVDSLAHQEVQVYAPLAVGHHVDHQIVFQAALLLRSKGFRVQFYEDFPYAEDAEKLSQALQQWIFPPVPHVQTLNKAELEARIAAICLYRSQLGALFGGESHVAHRVESYALTVGAKGSYAERYWHGGTQ